MLDPILPCRIQVLLLLVQDHLAYLFMLLLLARLLPSRGLHRFRRKVDNTLNIFFSLRWFLFLSFGIHGLVDNDICGKLRFDGLALVFRLAVCGGHFDA